MTRVVACGLATVDVIHVLDSLPGPDEKVVARSTTIDAGGPALNAAVTASLLGVPATLISAIGPSPFATVVLADVGRHGVRLIDLAGPAHRLPVASVLVTDSNGNRAVVSQPAADLTTRHDLTTHRDLAAYRDVDGELLAGAAAVLVDGHHLPLARAVARQARQRGIPVVLDGGSWKPGLDALLHDVDVAVVSAGFTTPAGGDPLEGLLASGPTFVARTDGPGPVTWRRSTGTSGTLHPPLVDVVDTLGAGDVLHGALAAQLARHGTVDPLTALADAVAVATRSVQHRGVRGWAAAIPPPDAIRR
jgi:sugar/nucleoside kinase (ribokinase family)